MRLQTGIGSEAFKADDFLCLACGVVSDAPAEALASLLSSLVELESGANVALDILYMYFHCAKDDNKPIANCLLVCGRELLKRADFSNGHSMRDHYAGAVAKICLAPPEAEEDAHVICINLRTALMEFRTYSYNVNRLLEGLLQAQPDIALDIFLSRDSAQNNHDPFDFGFDRSSPVESLDVATLCEWADKDASARYPLLGTAISLFATKNFDQDAGLSPLFLEVMRHAPGKAEFLGDGYTRLLPSGWSGSLADILTRRRGMLGELASDPDPVVRSWYAEQRDRLDSWIAHERERESEREEGFE